MKINRYGDKDEVILSLRRKGFTCLSLLCSIEIEDDTNDPTLGIFLSGEIRRIQDFARISFGLESLPFQKDPASLRHSIILMPGLRTILECFFRVDYIFCILRMGYPLDWHTLNERFSRIVETCRHEYNRFAEKRAQFLTINRNVTSVKGDSRPLSVLDMLTKTHSDSASPRDNDNNEIAYSLYSLCSFYSHGYMNAGLIKTSGISDVAHPDINLMLEVISNAYLRYFIALTEDSGVSSGIVQEIEDAFENSAYLKNNK